MVRIPFTTSFFPIAALAILTAMVGCEAPSSKESVDPELDAHSPQGCDPGAFYSCVCDDGTDGLAECLSSDDLAACVCDGAPVDTIDPADSLDDGQVADTATTDVVVPPEDGGTDVGDGGGPTMDEAGLVQGMVSAQIGKKQMFVHSAFVHLERQDEKSKTFTTDMNGHYVIYGVEPGLWRACAALDGLNEKTCTENFELGIDTVRLPPIVLEIEPPFAWGRVTLSNGQPCVYRMPDFNLTVDTFVEAGETSMVPVNSQGQFLIPGYSGPLKAVCEGAVVDSKTAGTEPVKMVFTDMAPDIGPVILSSPQGSAMRPKLGAKVNVSVSAGDPSGGPLLVRWRTGGASPMYMEGHNVVWPMPETPYNATLYGLVSNGKGHHVRIAAKARPGTPLSYVGQLSRENGEPLQGAVIRINNEQTMTNDQGRYQLILSGDAPVYVTQVRHPDYTPCFQIQHDSWRGSIPDELHNGAGNARCLKPLQKTIINAESGDIVGGEMLKINIPGSALQMPDGKLVTGPVEVA